MLEEQETLSRVRQPRGAEQGREGEAESSSDVTGSVSRGEAAATEAHQAPRVDGSFHSDAPSRQLEDALTTLRVKAKQE